MPPKKSSSSSSKAASDDATLVPHRTPELAALLRQCAGCPTIRNVKLYLDAGGQPSALVKFNYRGKLAMVPLLHLVVTTHHPEVSRSVEMLVKAGVDVDAISPNLQHEDATALHRAAECPEERCCCIESMRVLIEAGADPCKQAALDGTSILHAAVAAGRKDKCRLLIKASSGRVLHLRDSNGVSLMTL
jgi:Ankyrin repeats (3 copies)